MLKLTATAIIVTDTQSEIRFELYGGLREIVVKAELTHDGFIVLTLPVGVFRLFDNNTVLIGPKHLDD